MATRESSPCIVVGYDGSPSSRAALRLAVAHARGRGIAVGSVERLAAGQAEEVAEVLA